MSDLLPMPVQKQTDTVSDFIRKSAIGFDKTAIEEVKPVNFNQKLQELSQKTGISIKTLMQVKTVEHQVREQRAVLNRTVMLIDDKKKTDQQLALANQVRQIMQQKQTSTIRVSDLLRILASQSQEDFMSMCKRFYFSDSFRDET